MLAALTEPGSVEERQKYGANRIAEGKLPMCASLCSTKALLAGDAEQVSDIFRQRVVERGAKVPVGQTAATFLTMR